jgi:hypothetical protein
MRIGQWSRALDVHPFDIYPLALSILFVVFFYTCRSKLKNIPVPFPIIGIKCAHLLNASKVSVDEVDAWPGIY